MCACRKLITVLIAKVDVELHPSFKNVLNLFVCIKLNLFFYNFPFFIRFIPLVDIIGIKPASGDHESNFKKVVAIPCTVDAIPSEPIAKALKC